MCVKLPSRLSNCPIIDALVELRFESNLNKSLIFGYMYKQIVELYPHEYPNGVISLPVLQIPEAIRNSDPNMRFKPLYRLKGKVQSFKSVMMYFVLVRECLITVGMNLRNLQ